jgi:ABC-type Fe3+-hydroxamate transport system substrate-binding protein
LFQFLCVKNRLLNSNTPPAKTKLILAGGAAVKALHLTYPPYCRLLIFILHKKMPIYTDQIGRTVDIPGSPSRIVSLVPSQTELLFSLGLDKQVVGITKFCVHPNNWYRTKTRVGGTKTVNQNAIHALQPDLIVANKEENVKEQVDALTEKYPVWVSDVHNLASALAMMEQFGSMTGTAAKAAAIINDINKGFSTLPPPKNKIPTAYLIWRNPYMSAGGDTFIHDMLDRCGLNNIFGHLNRYPSITIEQLKDCRLLLLSSEPYPFKQQHIDELQGQLPNTKILLVDGELFSWYGSRLLHAPAYFSALLRQVHNFDDHDLHF